MSILIISNDNDFIETLKQKIELQRYTDTPISCNHKDSKKLLKSQKFDLIIIDGSKEDILKITQNTECNAIIANTVEDLELYNEGISDFINDDISSTALNIKILNCLKNVDIKNQLIRNRLYLEQNGVIKLKNQFYKPKFIKEIWTELLNDYRIKNGIFCALTLENSTKTKVSINRLACIIKKNIRSKDIAVDANNDIFYIIFENITPQNVKNILFKIQDNMGEDFKIRAGINKIGIQDINELIKNTKDSLLASIKDNIICKSLNDDIDTSDWLDNSENIPQTKQFKLFRSIYENKLKNIIEPAFFRFEKDFCKKLNIIQYTNKAESALNIKSEKCNSELILRYDGFTKISAEITHSGLDSAENYKTQISFNNFTEKELDKLLKRLKNEHIEACKS